MPLSRRELLTRSGAVGVGVLLTGSIDGLFSSPATARAAAAAGPGGAYGYGPLVADPGGILDLPQGFRYRVVSRAGDRLTSGTGVVPGAHDGMGVFGRKGKPTALVRNHEITSASGASATAAAAPDRVFDPKAGGGTTTLTLGSDNQRLAEFVSLAGTIRNCAGGKTPWDSWITCEETEIRAGGSVGYTQDHGWNFEVDAFDDSNNSNPVPLKAMGRFAHEAVAVDPATGVVYQTEDASGPFGLLYRFVPNERLGGYGSLRAGGALAALRVDGVEDLATVTQPGTVLTGISWVPVPDPLATTTSTRRQFAATGVVTRAQKLEGAWWGGDSLFFASSYQRGTTGPVNDGQVWKYTPGAETLELVLHISPDSVFDSPDNICVSPYGGGVMIAEDGGGEQYLVGTTVDNEPFAFARNALNNDELAGVVFTDDGTTLFASLYTPGITLAITGPWTRKNV